MVEDPNALLNRRQAATFLGVSPQLISMWKLRRKLTPAEVTRDGQTLYRIADLRAVELATRRSMKSSRNWRRGMPALA